MKIKLLLLAAMFAVFAVSLQAQTKVAPKISAIRAQLFYDTDASLSKDILADNEVALWNTIIGEGSAAAPSTSTLVTIEISGKNVPLGTLKVEITATGFKNKLLQKKLIDVELYDAREKFYAPVLLNDTGCDPIKISARLVGKGAPVKAVVKTIPFKCGE